MKILLVSLGCDKNLVDSEVMLGMLAEKGYTFTDDEAEAEIAVAFSREYMLFYQRCEGRERERHIGNGGT